MIKKGKDNKLHKGVREKIIARAAELFTQRGVRDVTMDEISSSLSISKRTLYEIFEDKEVLLVECIRKHQEKVDKEINATIKNSNNVLEVILKGYGKSIEELHGINFRFFQDINRYPKAATVFAEKHDRDVRGSVLFFREGVEQGIFRDDINFEIFIILFHKQFDMLIKEDDWRNYCFFDLYEFIIFTFLRGISTVKGLDIIEKFLVDFRKQNKLK
jgi:AcrR family transcriptional regulator